MPHLLEQKQKVTLYRLLPGLALISPANFLVEQREWHTSTCTWICTWICMHLTVCWPFRLAGCGCRWRRDTGETVCLTLHRGSCCDQKCIKVGNKTWNVKLEKTSTFCSWSLEAFLHFFIFFLNRRSSLIVHRNSQVAVRTFYFIAKCHRCLKAH